MFSFDTKREPEKCQRFRRAGATKKGLHRKKLKIHACSAWRSF